MLFVILLVAVAIFVSKALATITDRHKAVKALDSPHQFADKKLYYQNLKLQQMLGAGALVLFAIVVVTLLPSKAPLPPPVILPTNPPTVPPEQRSDSGTYYGGQWHRHTH